MAKIKKLFNLKFILIFIFVLINFSFLINANNEFNETYCCDYIISILEDYIINQNLNNCTINNTINNNSANNINNSIFFTTNLDKKFYEEGSSVLINHDTNLEDNFIIEYWIEDLNRNIIKNKFNTTNLNQKTWTARTNLVQEGFLINSILYNLENNTYFNSSKLIIVKSEKNLELFENKIIINNINSIHDNHISFGETFFLDLKIEKADSSKSLISAYIKNNTTKLSEITKLYIYGKNVDQRIIIPITMKSNCNNKFANGEYELIIEGIDTISKKNLTINDNLDNMCQIIESNNTIDSNETSNNYKIPKIKSFYTLVRNYNENINLFANFENIENKVYVKIISKSQNSIYEINSTDKLKIPVYAFKENNIYVLKLFDDNKLLDLKYIQVNFSVTEDEKLTHKNSSKSINNQKNITNNNLLNSKENNLDVKSNDTNLLTSGFLFKSVSIKSKELISFFIIVILIILIIIIYKIDYFKNKFKLNVEKYLNKLLFYKKYGKRKKNYLQSNYRNDWCTKKAY
ncbi:MAG: hypothetical protein ACOC3X_02410 [Nanoarchaeota archaeon]